mmetsp:Transcript_21985/g.35261  ORF Transcript_21985/g.35261 Transcript_21985/m.35261 type:complete len:122 (-) Transcript_21985:90-455(-)
MGLHPLECDRYIGMVLRLGGCIAPRLHSWEVALVRGSIPDDYRLISGLEVEDLKVTCTRVNAQNLHPDSRNRKGTPLSSKKHASLEQKARFSRAKGTLLLSLLVHMSAFWPPPGMSRVGHV